LSLHEALKGDSLRDTEVINIQEIALTAYQKMHDKGVSGLAVVNDNDELIASISASDVKGSLQYNIFTDLYLPVGMYLEKCTPTFQRENSATPLSCTMFTTIAEIVKILATNHVHRLFVVDDSKRPIGVLSLSDIITFLNKNK